MGKLSPESTFVVNQNQKYRAPLRGKGQMQGRVLYRAYEENNGKATVGVLKAIKTAGDKLNQRASVRG